MSEIVYQYQQAYVPNNGNTFHFWVDCTKETHDEEAREGGTVRTLYTAPPAPVLRVQELTVWYGAMPETNGKSNWTAILHRKGECISTGITIDRSEYPDRVRYEADRMRYLIGELDIKPSILSYDGSKHSGYVQPVPPAPVLRVAIDFSALDRLAGKFLQASVGRGGRVSSAYAECAHLLATEVKLLRAAGYEVK